MGQQQLLLIVLSTIIVGISIVVGMQLVSSSAEHANTDAGSQGLMTLAARAQEWYRKPAFMGGGGDTFGALTNTAAMTSILAWPDSSQDGKYSVSAAGGASNVEFQFVGKEGITLNADVYSDSVSITRP